MKTKMLYLGVFPRIRVHSLACFLDLIQYAKMLYLDVFPRIKVNIFSMFPRTNMHKSNKENWNALFGRVSTH